MALKSVPAAPNRERAMLDHDELDRIMAEAARIALGLWPGGGHRLRSWDKRPGDPVSEADLALDRFLRAELGALLPAAGWLSEETADNPARLAGGLVWVVDPIDGTRDFVRGRPGWSVSVALVSGGRPLLARLEAPARGERWTAQAGAGATRNGVPLSLAPRDTLAGARIPADTLGRADTALVTVPKPNSVALRIGMVAAGEADLLVTRRWGWEWDVAAATLIAREAGAEVTDALGEPLRFNKRDPRAFGLCVAGPALHGAALAHFAGRAPPG